MLMRAATRESRIAVGITPGIGQGGSQNSGGDRHDQSQLQDVEHILRLHSTAPLSVPTESMALCVSQHGAGFVPAPEVTELYQTVSDCRE